MAAAPKPAARPALPTETARGRSRQFCSPRLRRAQASAPPDEGRGSARELRRCCAYRTRLITTDVFSARPLHRLQFGEQWSEHAAAAALSFGAAGEDLCQLAKHLRGLMARLHFGDHLAVVCSG